MAERSVLELDQNGQKCTQVESDPYGFFKLFLLWKPRLPLTKTVGNLEGPSPTSLVTGAELTRNISFLVVLVPETYWSNNMKECHSKMDKI